MEFGENEVGKVIYEHVYEKNEFHNNLHIYRDLVYVRNHLAKVACEIYGLESMIYLTTGIIDRFDNPKVELECAATKVYSQEILRNLSEIATDVIGSPATISGHSIGLEITNATQLQFGERGLKSYIGQTGLRHALVSSL